MSVRWWSHLDDALHFLYEPTGLGKRGYRHRWHHNIHLIPGTVVEYVCFRYDIALGLTETEAHQGLCNYRSPRTKRVCWRYHVYDGLCARHYRIVHKGNH